MNSKKSFVILLMSIMSALVLCGCGLFGQSEPDTQTRPEYTEEESEQSDSAEGNEADISQDSESVAMNSRGGAQGYFTTTDLYGNEVSQEIFTESKLTVVNVWATYCGPCILEMPYLGELAEEYDSTQVQFVGIPTDVYNQEYLEYALSLVEETGADYTHLLLSEELYNWGLSDIQYVPTTFFVNSEGEILDTVVGSMSKEDWKELIDSKLASV